LVDKLSGPISSIQRNRGLFVVPRAEEEGLAREWKFLWREVAPPFYREKYRTAGFGPEVVPNRSELPLTRASELRADEAKNAPFGSYRLIVPDDAVELSAWRDADGAPFLIFYGERDVRVRDDELTTVLRRFGLQEGDRFAHTRSDGLQTSGVSRVLSELRVPELAVGVPTSDQDAAAHLELWQLLQPSWFLITGHMLHRYIRVARRLGRDPATIFGEKTLVLMDPLYQFDGPRQEMERRLGARIQVLDLAPEVPALIAGDCGEHSGLHLDADYLYLDIVDPASGQPVPDGERGHLVVTTVGLDSLWIRYDLERYGYIDRAPCACGRPGPRLVQLGRANHSVPIDGRVITPVDVRRGLDVEFDRRFTLSVRPDGALGVDVEAGGADLAEIGNRLRAELSVRVDVAPARAAHSGDERDREK
jgi:phenylacetate-CoA ligase